MQLGTLLAHTASFKLARYLGNKPWIKKQYILHSLVMPLNAYSVGTTTVAVCNLAGCQAMLLNLLFYDWHNIEQIDFKLAVWTEYLPLSLQAGQT